MRRRTEGGEWWKRRRRRRGATVQTTPCSSVFMLPSTRRLEKSGAVSLSLPLSSFLCHFLPLLSSFLSSALLANPSLPLSLSLPDFLSSRLLFPFPSPPLSLSLALSLSLCVTGERLSVKMPSCSPDCCLLQAVEVRDFCMCVWVCVFVSFMGLCHQFCVCVSGCQFASPPPSGQCV